MTNLAVARTFQGYPNDVRKKLLDLRKLILEVGKELKEHGSIEETLKWGEPSYLITEPRVGTTVRIHWLKSKPNQIGMYFNCQTTLIQDFKNKFGNQFNYEGKRALIFDRNGAVPLKAVKECVRMGLTYHLKP